MIERTEELALAARLPIVVGEENVTLRTLNLDESDDWLKLLDDLGDLDSMGVPTEKLISLVLAYDIDGVLGGNETSLRKRFTKRQLQAAVEGMVTAEAPLAEQSRSVVTASGLFRNLGPLAYQLAVRSQQESSTSGPSLAGASTRKRSAKPSLKSVS